MSSIIGQIVVPVDNVLRIWLGQIAENFVLRQKPVGGVAVPFLDNPLGHTGFTNSTFSTAPLGVDPTSTEEAMRGEPLWLIFDSSLGDKGGDGIICSSTKESMLPEKHPLPLFCEFWLILTSYERP